MAAAPPVEPFDVCRFLVLAVTRESLQRPWVKWEWTTFMARPARSAASFLCCSKTYRCRRRGRHPGAARGGQGDKQRPAAADAVADADILELRWR